LLAFGIVRLAYIVRIGTNGRLPTLASGAQQRY
jgi:hypothetical protein